MTDLSKVKWIVNRRMFEYEKYSDLPYIIREYGMECKVIDNIPMHIDNPYDNLFPITDCVIPYLTINNARKLNAYYGMYLRETNLLYHTYTSLMGLDPDTFLNNGFVMTTFYNFKRTFRKWYDGHNTNILFVRPDSGIKTFTGTPIKLIDCEAELRALNDKVDNDSIIHIGLCKQFRDETRFIICGDTVVDGSRYSTDSGERRMEDTNYPKELYDFAVNIAKCAWKPDEVFTLDVCMTNDGPKIVEINSFSCAGWYAANPHVIVKAVSDHTLKLYNDQYN